MLRRLAAGAIPAGLSTAVVAFLPFAGRFFLDDDMYAVWALLATVGTVGLVFDFGAPALATRVSAQSSVSRRQALGLAFMSASGSILVGVLASAFWPLYVKLTELPDVEHMQILLLAVGLGSGLRSVVTVGCGLALGQARFLIRGAMLLVQAIVQFLVTVALLAFGSALMSMVIGQFISALIALCIAGVSLRTEELERPAAVNMRDEALKFLRARGVAAVIGLSFTQLDRWIVGVVATPSFLATYDIAARLASIPKIIVLTLGLSYLFEAARSSHSVKELASLLRKLVSVNAAILAASFAGCVLLILLWEYLEPGFASPTFVWLFVLLGVANFVNAMTAPGVMVLTGRGHPEVELFYLVPSVVLSSLAVIPALITGNVWAAAVGLSAPLTLGSLAFVVGQRRLLTKYISAPVGTTP
jgi:O-antigen/teichoic acid export membrane protein